MSKCDIEKLVFEDALICLKPNCKHKWDSQRNKFVERGKYKKLLKLIYFFSFQKKKTHEYCKLDTSVAYNSE